MSSLPLDVDAWRVFTMGISSSDESTSRFVLDRCDIPVGEEEVCHVTAYIVP
jgi:hypothetical protein